MVIGRDAPAVTQRTVGGAKHRAVDPRSGFLVSNLVQVCGIRPGVTGILLFPKDSGALRFGLLRFRKRPT